jgi:hypothetical protein
MGRKRHPAILMALCRGEEGDDDVYKACVSFNVDGAPLRTAVCEVQEDGVCGAGERYEIGLLLDMPQHTITYVEDDEAQQVWKRAAGVNPVHSRPACS